MDRNYQIVRSIMLATNQIDGVYYFLAKKLGVNENALAFLYALDDGQPHSQKEISDAWLIPRTTIHSIVKMMQKEGYIQFCTEQHKKEKAIILTEKGQKYTDSLLADIMQWRKAIVETLRNYPSEFVSVLKDFSNRLYHEFMGTCQSEKGRSENG